MNFEESSDRVYSGYVKFFAIMSMILLCIAYFRISNSNEPISLVNFFDFLSNHFSAISTKLNDLQIPYTEVHYHTPKFFQSMADLWNKITDFINIFTYLLSLVLKVLYTSISVLIWILTGVTI